MLTQLARCGGRSHLLAHGASSAAAAVECHTSFPCHSVGAVEHSAAADLRDRLRESAVDVKESAPEEDVQEFFFKKKS